MLNRRLLMVQAGKTPPGGGIVTDGLVLHLDGLDRGGVPGQWKELISGKNFILSNVIEKEKSIEFLGTSTSYGVIRENAFGAYDNIGTTIQAALILHNTGSNIIYMASRGGSTDKILATYNGNYIISNGRPPKPTFKILNKANSPATVSMNTEEATINKTKIYPDGTESWGNGGSGNCFIGCRAFGNAPFSGELFALRIYDRILTDEEILQNQQYDIDTYFGGVVPE